MFLGWQNVGKTTSDSRIKETKIERQWDTIFVYVFQLIVPIFAPVEQL